MSNVLQNEDKKTHLSFVLGICLSNKRGMVDEAVLGCVMLGLQRSEQSLLST